MSNALMKRGSGNTTKGVVSAVCSGFLPGLGQMVNGEKDKALGVFVTWGACAAVGVLGIPLLGGAAWLIGGTTWVYSVADGYFTGRKT